MTEEIPKAYDPKNWEEQLIKKWEASGFANPDTAVARGVAAPDAPPFSIVLPPPNVTGTLHTGSACMLAIEDTVVRYRRMKGDRTLWIPGTDHAAIATQSKVERILFESEGQTRHNLGREKFLRRVTAFAEESRTTIRRQIARLGASVDWSREAYTLDEKRELAVRTAFRTMYDDGLIYRGERIVNWDPHMQTTVSDDEIEWREEKTPLYYLQYGPFTISTARPETKFGDKYVVVHPEDERYAAYQHGQTIELEWINGPVRATVIKDTAIDREFGTGAMTITPWHDVTDFDIAERHGLEKEQIIDEAGQLLPVAGEFSGLPIAEAREKIVEKLRAKNLVVKIEEGYSHNIATNSRGGGLIEPQIKKQWFVGVNTPFERNGRTVTLKSLMREAVQSGAIALLPERFTKNYFHWIDNLRDWCISRQIWYGHRIPVWYRSTDAHGRPNSTPSASRGALTEEIYCGIEPPAGEGWEQDPDTLDTWFSSGLWTFSTLGWPTFAETATAGKPGPENDLANYHPTTLLETGYDILPFWVSRMILLSLCLRREVPFRTVYLHGLVRDDQGRKMSKSLDNIIDPLDVIEQYGTDALRLALVIGSTPGNDLKLGDEKIAAMRNFTNKLWNIGRYVIQFSREPGSETAPSLADAWILDRLSSVVRDVTKYLENYQLSLAGETLRDFTWNDFADWYVEIHKIEKNDAVLRRVFETLLRLWHPFMPFVTEALFESFGKDADALLMIERWPVAETTRPADEFARVQELVTRLRNLRALYRIDAKKPISLVLATDNPLYQANAAIIERLARIDAITYEKRERLPEAARLVGPDYQAFVPLSGIIDIAAEKKRLAEERRNLERYRTGLAARLADPAFTTKAPQAIIEQQQEGLAATDKKLAELQAALASLE